MHPRIESIRSHLRRWGRRSKRRRPLAYAPEVEGERFLFIGGLHRSGTSVFHRLLREHPSAGGFAETGFPEDEGQHLQTVYPPARAFGGPGRFAFDPRARLTEDSQLVSPQSRDRLLREWGAYLDLVKPVLLEKSPPNLIRSRFLEALFPGARFVFMVRHPIAVALATRKWAGTSVAELVEHWCIAHRLLLDDLPYIEHKLVLRYEDLVRTPDAILRRVFELAGLPNYGSSEPVADHNEKYFSLWEGEERAGIGEELGVQSEIFTRFGYDMTRPYVVEPHRLMA